MSANKLHCRGPKRRLPVACIVHIDPIDLVILKHLRHGWKRVAYAKGLRGSVVDVLEQVAMGRLLSPQNSFEIGILLGDLLYREMIELLGRHTLRLHDFEVHVSPGKAVPVEIHARALEYVRPFTYRLPFQPNVFIEKKPYSVAYNFRDDDHFVLRLEERTIVDPTNYFCKGQSFSYLYRWIYFEIIPACVVAKKGTT